MAWTLGDVRVVVTKLNDIATQDIARLQPLASGTLYHIFGYEFLIKKLNAYIVGSTDKNTLISFTRTGDTYELFYNATTWGDYYVKSATFDMQNCVSQNFLVDGDHACDDPVYLVDLELFKSEG
jgi:hypothetical protein